MARTVQPDSISGKFRKIFADDPQRLYNMSNNDVLALYTEMTGEATTEKHRSNLNNLRSLLKREDRQKGKKAPAGKPAKASNGTPIGRGVSRLEKLEEAIDDCLLHARALDREGLHKVIHHLREARNEVVWLQGQK